MNTLNATQQAQANGLLQIMEQAPAATVEKSESSDRYILIDTIHGRTRHKATLLHDGAVITQCEKIIVHYRNGSLNSKPCKKCLPGDYQAMIDAPKIKLRDTLETAAAALNECETLLIAVVDGTVRISERAKEKLVAFVQEAIGKIDDQGMLA